MDELLVGYIAQTFKSYHLYQEMTHLNISIEILVARLESKRELDLFSEAEKRRLEIVEKCRKCEHQFRKAFEITEAYAIYLARQSAEPNNTQAQKEILERIYRIQEREFVGHAEPAVEPAVSVRRWMFRYCCPDGTVLYGPKEACDLIERMLNNLFGRKTWYTTFMYISDPEQRYIPELRTLHGSSTGSFDIPESIPDPPKRWHCIYRIFCPDGTVHFADGGVAYDRLYATLKFKYKIRKCEIMAVLADNVPDSWISELQRLYGTQDGGYKIPFPPEPPKRKRQKYICPSCGSSKSRILQGNEHECRSCSNRFTI